MFIPEYSITPKILRNISEIEYGKAIVENITILPTLEKKLQKEALTKILVNSMESIGLNYPSDEAKKTVDKLIKPERNEIINILNVFNSLGELAKNTEIEDTDVKYINKQLTENIVPKAKQGVYRSKYIENNPSPEEIPARLVQFFDWYNGLDAKDTHPVVKAAVVKAILESIKPFEYFNTLTVNVTVYLSLKINYYNFRDYMCLEDYYKRTKTEYEQQIEYVLGDSPDLTKWIEYFTENMAMEISNLREKIKSLAKDTKIAKATGRTKLSQRQERVIEYLQDYGLLQNKDFSRLFPNISEDTVLRDLKVLLDKEIIVKRGSTKSSRYELS